MDTELLKESWEKLTERGYTLSRPAPEVVNIITPTGYSTQIRLKRLPSYARYVRWVPSSSSSLGGSAPSIGEADFQQP